MWKLTIEDDEGQRTSLELGQTEYAVGRAEDASIRLTERNVSRKHAVLRLVDNAWELEDLTSYNGTYVNGERVPNIHTLQLGDVLQIADYRLELVDAGDEEVVADEPPDERRRRPHRLVMVIGPSPGHEFALAGERLRVGRAEDAEVSINHASVSRHHAELIHLGESRWEVIDHGSSNGIRVNGVDLRRGIIEPGDALEFGDVRLRFVAAGKYFRPAVDLSQQLPAMAFESLGPTSGISSPDSRWNRWGVMLGLGTVLLLSGVGFYVARQSGWGTTETAPKLPVAKTEAEAQRLFDQAEAMAKDSKFDAAHQLLTAIPESSSLRQTEEFRAIEDAWADLLFRRVEATTDTAEKERMLNAIIENDAVDEARRLKAIEQAGKLGFKPTRTSVVPRPPLPAPAAPRPQPPNVIRTSPYDTPPTPGPEPVVAPTPPAPDKFNEKAAKGRLLARMHAGTASEGELRQLKSICMNDHDRACRNAAAAALAAMRKRNQK